MAGFEHYAWLMKSEPSEVSVDDVLQMDAAKSGGSASVITRPATS